MTSVLVVVAHPDDEALGCGGTISRLAARGYKVRTCVLAASVSARAGRPDSEALLQDLCEAQRVLGCGEPILGEFPNIKLNVVPHLELVQFVEAAIVETGAGLVITHHPHDLNDDHRNTSRACQAAVRLFQRRPGVEPLTALLFMEVLSSTDWAFTDDQFWPNLFFELEDEGLEAKLRAVHAYRGVAREFPHPRSDEIVRGLAALRGGQAGMRYAEGFVTGFLGLSRLLPLNV